MGNINGIGRVLNGVTILNCMALGATAGLAGYCMREIMFEITQRPGSSHTKRVGYVWTAFKHVYSTWAGIGTMSLIVNAGPTSRSLRTLALGLGLATYVASTICDNGLHIEVASSPIMRGDEIVGRISASVPILGPYHTPDGSLNAVRYLTIFPMPYAVAAVGPGAPDVTLETRDPITDAKANWPLNAFIPFEDAA